MNNSLSSKEGKAATFVRYSGGATSSMLRLFGLSDGEILLKRVLQSSQVRFNLRKGVVIGINHLDWLNGTHGKTRK